MKNNAFMSEVVNGENPNPNDNIFAGVVSREKSGNQEGATFVFLFAKSIEICYDNTIT